MVRLCLSLVTFVSRVQDLLVGDLEPRGPAVGRVAVQAVAVAVATSVPLLLLLLILILIPAPVRRGPVDGPGPVAVLRLRPGLRPALPDPLGAALLLRVDGPGLQLEGAAPGGRLRVAAQQALRGARAGLSSPVRQGGGKKGKKKGCSLLGGRAWCRGEMLSLIPPILNFAFHAKMIIFWGGGEVLY